MDDHLRSPSRHRSARASAPEARAIAEALLDLFEARRVPPPSKSMRWRLARFSLSRGGWYELPMPPLFSFLFLFDREPFVSQRSPLPPQPFGIPDAELAFHPERRAWIRISGPMAREVAP